MKEDIPAEWSFPRTTLLRANQLCPRLSCWDFFKRPGLKVPEAILPACKTLYRTAWPPLRSASFCFENWSPAIKWALFLFHPKHFFIRSIYVWKIHIISDYSLTHDCCSYWNRQAFLNRSKNKNVCVIATWLEWCCLKTKFINSNFNWAELHKKKKIMRKKRENDILIYTLNYTFPSFRDAKCHFRICLKR